jgi:hypothetical protein
VKRSTGKIFLIFSLTVFTVVLGAGYIIIFGDPSFSLLPATSQQYLIPSDSNEPAAGICVDAPEGNEVIVSISKEIPDPRCQKIKLEQFLVIKNNTNESIEFWIGESREIYASIGFGIEYAIEMPVGNWLDEGVHRINTDGFNAPEIWLVLN